MGRTPVYDMQLQTFDPRPPGRRTVAVNQAINQHQLAYCFSQLLPAFFIVRKNSMYSVVSIRFQPATKLETSTIYRLVSASN